MSNEIPIGSRQENAGAQHTPGKLYLDPDDPLCFCDDLGGLGRVYEPEPYGNRHATDVAIATTNARRVVAAWNACADIPTEALEAGTIKARVAELVKLLAVRTATVDKLLAALEGCRAGTITWGRG